MTIPKAIGIAALAIVWSLVAETVVDGWSQPLYIPLADLAVGWALVVSGLVGMIRRPGQVAGGRLVIAGFLWWVGNFAGGHRPEDRYRRVRVPGLSRRRPGPARAQFPRPLADPSHRHGTRHRVGRRLRHQLGGPARGADTRGAARARRDRPGLQLLPDRRPRSPARCRAARRRGWDPGSASRVARRIPPARDAGPAGRRCVVRGGRPDGRVRATCRARRHRAVAGGCLRPAGVVAERRPDRASRSPSMSASSACDASDRRSRRDRGDRRGTRPDQPRGGAARRAG